MASEFHKKMMTALYLAIQDNTKFHLYVAILCILCIIICVFECERIMHGIT